MTEKEQLHFQHSGEWYVVNKEGYIIQQRRLYEGFSKRWRFLGVSKHHWRVGIDVALKSAFANPENLIGGIVWDVDCGTTRQWGGRYNGKIPRITNAYTTDSVK